MHQDLVRLQRQNGLTLAFLYGRVIRVNFADRSQVVETSLESTGALGPGAISPSGTQIAFQRGESFWIERRDTSNPREYPHIGTYGVCWSPDETRIALISNDATSSLEILNVQSGTLHQIDREGSVTSQCWSPKGNEIVYSVSGDIRIYQTDTDSSRSLAAGTEATWSPDGTWIGFLGDDSYYVIRPDGRDQRELFKAEGALSGLWWSPDCRFVAYLARERGFEGPWWRFDVDFARVRVRRLSDGSDDWVADVIYFFNSNLQWLINKGAEA